MKASYFSLAVLIAAICLRLDAGMAAPINSQLPIMNQSSSMIPSVTMSTFCMGRFLIDVPAGSMLSGGNYKYDFMVIEPMKSMTLEGFEKDVAKRELELKSVKNKDTKQGMLLQSVRPEENARILTSWEADFGTDVISVNGYRWINSSRYQFKLDVAADRQESGMNRMRDALSRLRARADSDIPTEPGYCFAGGFISNPRWRNEEAGVDFRIAGHPDRTQPHGELADAIHAQIRGSRAQLHDHDRHGRLQAGVSRQRLSGFRRHLPGRRPVLLFGDRCR